MMKLAFSSNGLRSIDLMQALGKIKAAGYGGAEISLHPAHLHPDIHDETFVQTVAQTTCDWQLPICNIHTGAKKVLSDVDFEPSLITPDAAGRRRRLDLIRRACGLARRLSCPLVTVTSGFTPAGETGEAAWRRLCDGLAEALDFAGDGVRMAIEAEPGMLVGDTGDLLRLLGRFPDLRVTLDLGHVVCVGEEIPWAVEQLGERIALCHIYDIQGRRHVHEIPGRGDIDFAAALEALDRSGFSGYAVVELYTYEATPEVALAESRAAFSRPELAGWFDAGVGGGEE